MLIAAAALPLAIGRGIRLVWAARLWVMACASWGLALAAVRGDMGSFAPSTPVVLAPAAQDAHLQTQASVVLRSEPLADVLARQFRAMLGTGTAP